MPWRVLSIDAYGTLFRGGSDAFVALVRRLAERSGADAAALLALREERIRAVAAGPFLSMRERDRGILRDLAHVTGVALDVEATLDDLEREYRAVDLYPDARRLLDEVAGRTRWGVASNCDAAVMTSILEAHRLEPDFVVASETVRAYKPSRTFFDALVREAGAPASGVLHVGDSFVADVEGAKAAGFGAAWIVRPGGLPPPPGSKATPDVVLDDLSLLASKVA